MNTPTAEEFLNANSDYIYSPTTTINIMIEFAKLHVEATLKAVNENVKLLVVNHEEHREPSEVEDLLDYYECGSDIIYVSSSSILNAYPLNNIV